MTLHACDRAKPPHALLYEVTVAGEASSQAGCRAGLLATACSPLGHLTPLMMPRSNVRAVYGHTTQHRNILINK